jgi:hypothetical protein
MLIFLMIGEMGTLLSIHISPLRDVAAQTDSILDSATVNGIPLNPASPLITVAPGTPLSGSMQVSNRDPCSFCVLPVVGINSWDRTYYASLGNLDGDNAYHSFVFTFSFTAPTIPGDYYIVVLHAGCYSAADVVYGCYALGDPRSGVPGGGDDLWDLHYFTSWQSLLPGGGFSSGRAITIRVSSITGCSDNGAQSFISRVSSDTCFLPVKPGVSATLTFQLLSTLHIFPSLSFVITPYFVVPKGGEAGSVFLDEMARLMGVSTPSSFDNYVIEFAVVLKVDGTFFSNLADLLSGGWCLTPSVCITGLLSSTQVSPLRNLALSDGNFYAVFIFGLISGEAMPTIESVINMALNLIKGSFDPSSIKDFLLQHINAAVYYTYNNAFQFGISISSILDSISHLNLPARVVGDVVKIIGSVTDLLATCVGSVVSFGALLGACFLAGTGLVHNILDLIDLAVNLLFSSSPVTDLISWLLNVIDPPVAGISPIVKDSSGLNIILSSTTTASDSGFFLYSMNGTLAFLSGSGAVEYDMMLQGTESTSAPYLSMVSDSAGHTSVSAGSLNSAQTSGGLVTVNSGTQTLSELTVTVSLSSGTVFPGSQVTANINVYSSGVLTDASSLQVSFADQLFSAVHVGTGLYTVSLDTSGLAGGYYPVLASAFEPGFFNGAGSDSLLVYSVAGNAGPTGDQATLYTTFVPSDVTDNVFTDGSASFLLLASAQMWNGRHDVGTSLAICRNGTRISGDLFSLGATITHRHFATALALDTPPAGLTVYTVCFKTDPEGTAWVSSASIVHIRVGHASSSGPTGDQSTTSATFTPTAQSITVTADGAEQFVLIGSAQLWNDASNVGSSVAILRDDVRVSSDIFTLGATIGHRHIGTVVALDTPSEGLHTYSLAFKTDAGGRAWASSTYLLETQVTGALSSGPAGDQSTKSTTFTSSAQQITLSVPNSNSQYLVLGASQIWDDSRGVGASIAVTRDGARISGDMFTLGATIGHRHLPFASALDTPGSGMHSYSLAFKTDPTGNAWVSSTYLLMVPLDPDSGIV